MEVKPSHAPPQEQLLVTQLLRLTACICYFHFVFHSVLITHIQSMYMYCYAETINNTCGYATLCTRCVSGSISQRSRTFSTLPYRLPGYGRLFYRHPDQFCHILCTQPGYKHRVQKRVCDLLCLIGVVVL